MDNKYFNKPCYDKFHKNIYIYKLCIFTVELKHHAKEYEELTRNHNHTLLFHYFSFNFI